MRIPCDLPWIVRSTEKESHSLHGVLDARVIVNGPEDAPLCYVGVHAHSNCWPWRFVAYAFDEVVKRRAPGAVEVAMWDQSAVRDELGDVLLNHLPHSLDSAPPEDSADGAAVKKVQQECRIFFENDEGAPGE